MDSVIQPLNSRGQKTFPIFVRPDKLQQGLFTTVLWGRYCGSRNSDWIFIKKYCACHCEFKGPGKRGHIVADTLLPTQTFPRLPARATLICCGHKFRVRDTKNVSDFVQKHFVSATNVSQFAQPKKNHGQQCVRNNVSSFTRTLSKPRRQRQRDRRQTKGLMRRTIAVHVRYKSLYISLPFSAKQQLELSFDAFFSSFPLAESPPRDLQITAYE